MPEKNYLNPLKMKPFLRDTLWGGTRLRDEYGKTDRPDLPNIAESWEISTHPAGLSEITGGTVKEQTFADYLWAAGHSVISRKAKGVDFPLIIKYIDPRDWLSIQVHPPAGYIKCGPNKSGKTEMWYVVDAKPGSFLYYGVEHPTSRRDFRRHIQDDTLPEILHKAYVQPGDCFLLTPGTIHAIGPDILIAEIQQSCDLTYRVCDYGRCDANGKKRQLHIEDALNVSKLEPSAPTITGKPQSISDHSTLQRLVKCDYFTVSRLQLRGGDILERRVTATTFQVLMCLGGHFQITHQGIIYTFAKGETAYLPANMGDYTLAGDADILLTTL